MEHAYQEGWKELKRTGRDKEQELGQELCRVGNIEGVDWPCLFCDAGKF